MQKIKLFIISTLAAISLSPLLPIVQTVKAQGTADQIRCGITGDINQKDCKDTNDSDAAINNVVKMAIRIFQVIVGVIATFFVIYGGLTYITSGGSDAGIKTAKNTLLYAAIGLLVVGIAQIFVSFVLNRVSEVTTS